jgi:hypothetical protein
MATDPVEKVTPLERKKKKSPPADDLWLRRQAVTIAAQLPENRDDACAILRYAEEIVTEFIFVGKA